MLEIITGYGTPSKERTAAIQVFRSEAKISFNRSMHLLPKQMVPQIINYYLQKTVNQQKHFLIPYLLLALMISFMLSYD